MDEGLALESGDRYKEVRRYYARDKGRTTVEEVLGLIRHAAEGEGAVPAGAAG